MKRLISCCAAIGLILAAPSIGAQPGELAEGLVSSWMLVGVEKDADSNDPSRRQGARGVLIIDRAGHVFEFFSTIGRSEPESTQADPQHALQSWGGFWGRYSISDDGDSLDFEAWSGVSPNTAGRNFSRAFELDGDRLILTSTDEPHAQGNTRWTWQRVPAVEHLTPAYREVMGFWQHVVERQVNTETGEIRNERVRGPSVIVYSPGGFVGVHFPGTDREPVTDEDPTRDEAQQALRGYLGYFGTVSVFPGEVSHNLLAGISPGTGSILRRYADIDGDELTVTLQGFGGQNNDNRPRFVTEVVLRRLSDVDDMLLAR